MVRLSRKPGCPPRRSTTIWISLEKLANALTAAARVAGRFLASNTG